MEPDSDALAREDGRAGLNVAPVDYARFGLLLLHGGEWNGRRIVSRELGAHRDLGRRHFRGPRGLLPVLLVDRQRAARTLLRPGNFGQYAYVAPDADAVIVRNGSDWGSTTTSGWRRSGTSLTCWQEHHDRPRPRIRWARIVTAHRADVANGWEASGSCMPGLEIDEILRTDDPRLSTGIWSQHRERLEEAWLAEQRATLGAHRSAPHREVIEVSKEIRGMLPAGEKRLVAGFAGSGSSTRL